MMLAMAPKPTKPTWLAIARYVSGVVLIALTGAAALWSAQAPWLGTLSTLLALGVGKYFMIPTTDVLKLALQLLTPEQAVNVTVSALASLPPAEAERATTQLLASLPPAEAARVRSSIIPPAPKTPTTITFVDEAEGGGDT